MRPAGRPGAVPSSRVFRTWSAPDRVDRVEGEATDVATNLGCGGWIVATRHGVVLLRFGRTPRFLPRGYVAGRSAALEPYVRRSTKRRLRP